MTAILGGEVKIPSPYGFKTIKIMPNTKSGTRQKIIGAGIKTDHGSGNLYVRIDIEPYVALTVEQREMLEKLRSTETNQNRPEYERIMAQANMFY